MGNQSSRGEILRDSADPKLLLKLTEKGDLASVEHLISLGVNVNYRETTSRWTAMHYAAAEGHINIVKVLLHAKANVDPPSSDGTTPLILAASMNSVRIMDALVSAGASLKKANARGMTPLAIAVKVGHKDAVKWMLKAGADPLQPLDRGQSLLELCQDPVIRAMIESWIESPVPSSPLESSFTRSIPQIQSTDELKSANAVRNLFSDENEDAGLVADQVEPEQSVPSHEDIEIAVDCLKRMSLNEATMEDVIGLESELKIILAYVSKKRAQLEETRKRELEMLDE